MQPETKDLCAAVYRGTAQLCDIGSAFMNIAVSESFDEIIVECPCGYISTPADMSIELLRMVASHMICRGRMTIRKMD